MTVNNIMVTPNYLFQPGKNCPEKNVKINVLKMTESPVNTAYLNEKTGGISPLGSRLQRSQHRIGFDVSGQGTLCRKEGKITLSVYRMDRPFVVYRSHVSLAHPVDWIGMAADRLQVSFDVLWHAWRLFQQKTVS